MEDDTNIIPLYVRADGKMSTFEKLPEPGSHEWSKMIFAKYLALVANDKHSVDSLVNALHVEKLNELPIRLSGNIVTMLVRSNESYLSNLGSIEAIRQVDNTTFHFTSYVLSDLFVYLKRDLNLIEDLFDKISSEHIFMFHRDILHTCQRIIDG